MQFNKYSKPKKNFEICCVKAHVRIEINADTGALNQNLNAKSKPRNTKLHTKTNFTPTKKAKRTNNKKRAIRVGLRQQGKSDTQTFSNIRQTQISEMKSTLEN